MRVPALVGLAGLVHGLPATDVAGELRALQEPGARTAFCHGSELQSACPGYAKVMRWCCAQSEGLEGHNETCDMYAKSDQVCGGLDGMKRAMSACCPLEWACDGGYCGPPDEPKEKSDHAHEGTDSAGAARQQLKRDDSGNWLGEENIEVVTDGTKEGIDAGYAAEAKKAVAEAPKFDPKASDNPYSNQEAPASADASVPTEKCVSIAGGVNDYWCSTTCSEGKHCPKQLCRCGAEALRASTIKAKAHRDAQEPEDAVPEAPKSNITCRSLQAGVTDYWCTNACVSLLGGLAQSGCPKAVCSCGADTTSADRPANPDDVMKSLEDEQKTLGSKGPKAANSADQPTAANPDEVMKDLQDEQKTLGTKVKQAPSAHPADIMGELQDKQKAINDMQGSAPKWAESQQPAPKWAEKQKSAPTWADAHPTKAATQGTMQEIQCRVLDVSVNEDWCRTTCSSGPCPKKLCACGTLEDWAKGKLHTAPSPKPNPLVPAAIKHEMSCISLTPSITDDWCRTTCSQDPATCGDEEWCKCPKASCRCGVAENLVKPGEKAVWEQQKQEGSAPAAPALTCMSFSASVSDYWCSTQCGDGSACPKQCRCATAGAEAQEMKQQLELKRVQPAPAAGQTATSAPASSASESATGPKLTCKSLVASITDYWCSQQCGGGSAHCPKSQCKCL